MITQDHVVCEARTWLRTPFAHQHREIGVGVDCAGLLICVARKLGIVDDCFDVSPYSRYPDGESLRALCERYMLRANSLAYGGVILVAWGGGAPQHLGIVGRMPDGEVSLIHAESRRHKCVIEQRLKFGRSMRLIASYELAGVQYSSANN